MEPTNPMSDVDEIKTMVVAYAKQETLEPLKTLGRYLAFGLAGAVCLFIGMFFFSLGLLRLVQGFEIFEGGSWASTVPYLAALASLVVVLVVLQGSLSKAKSQVR